MNAETLEVVDLRTVESLDKELAVGFYDATETQFPTGSFRAQQGDLHIVVAVVHEVRFEARAGDFLHFVRQEGKVEVQALALSPL